MRITETFIEWVRYLRYRRRWGASTPTPNKILYLSPDEIEYTLSSRYLPENLIKEYKKQKKVYTITGGNWDKYKQKFTQDPHYQGVEELFSHNKNWHETSEYEWIKKECKTIDADKHFKKINTLYNSIKLDGYNDDYPITVCIGRNGEIIRATGWHRVSISKILGISKIPVIVRIRHQLWQEKRAKIHKSGTNVEIINEGVDLSHPDLSDII